MCLLILTLTNFQYYVKILIRSKYYEIFGHLIKSMKFERIMNNFVQYSKVACKNNINCI